MNYAYPGAVAASVLSCPIASAKPLPAAFCAWYSAVYARVQRHAPGTLRNNAHDATKSSSRQEDHTSSSPTEVPQLQQ
eukprot:971442-Pelagomonas_calceolata.AAC.1